ncbi:hypothetical protein EMCRGX_G017486 [Ephydatia muelleri]
MGHTFNTILGTRSYVQLRATFEEYEKVAHKDIGKSVDSEVSGDLKRGYLCIVQCVHSRASYFADRLYRSMKGLGTDDDCLIRIVVSRSEGTVTSAPDFNAAVDAAALHSAMYPKGAHGGTDERTITGIIGFRSNAQLQELKEKYKSVYGKGLDEDLRSHLIGALQNLVLALLDTKAMYDASCLRKAMKGLGTDEDMLIEILCTRTNQEILEISEAFKFTFGRDLEKDVASETSGHFKKLLVTLCKEGSGVDQERAVREAKELYDAGEGRLGTDEAKFTEIIGTRSFAQLRATFEEYNKIAHRDIISSIEREMSGDLKQAFKTIAQCVGSSHTYFAERLHQNLKGGLGTHEDIVIRIVVSHCENDLSEIKEKFLELYHKPLIKVIEGVTSGEYRKLLMAVVGPN